MKTLRNLFIALFVSTAFTFSSCSEAEDAVSAACSEANIRTLLDAVQTATQAYAADPTNSAKCADFKKAIQDFINVAENCPDVDQADIDAVKSQLANLPC